MLDVFTNYHAFSALHPVLQVMLVIGLFTVAYGAVEALGRARKR